MPVTPLVGPNVNFVVFELVAHLIHITSLSLQDHYVTTKDVFRFVSFFSGKNIDLLETLAEFLQTLTLKRRGLLRSQPLHPVVAPENEKSLCIAAFYMEGRLVDESNLFDNDGQDGKPSSIHFFNLCIL